MIIEVCVPEGITAEEIQKVLRKHLMEPDIVARDLDVYWYCKSFEEKDKPKNGMICMTHY